MVAAETMVTKRTLIYASSNGDRWFLCVGEEPADVFIYHEPNDPSGGAPSRIKLSTFLAPGRGSPERLMLLRLIGSLVEMADDALPTSPHAPEPGAAGAEPSPGEAASTT